jgi:predicted SnoaL-like aldol condensation-catalyzing enzyme
MLWNGRDAAQYWAAPGCFAREFRGSIDGHASGGDTDRKEAPMVTKVSAGLAVVVIVMTTPAFAQAPTLAPGCTATPAQLEANKKVAIEFFRPGVDRVALADPSYKQHNPAFVKGGREAKLSDYEYFKSRFGGPPRAGGPGGGAAGGGRGAAEGPQPPPGNPLEIVMAECDLVTIIHKNNRQDPTAAPGTFYEVFTFDTFRVRNGKLVEHWDGAVINPPAAPGAGGAPAGRGN